MEFPIELILGILLAFIFIALSNVFNAVRRKNSKSKESTSETGVVSESRRFKVPKSLSIFSKIKLGSKEKKEEKLKEIDKKLEEAISTVPTKSVEKTVVLEGGDELSKEASEKFRVEENLLEEMQSGLKAEASNIEIKEPENKTVQELPDLPEEDLNMNMDSVDEQFNLEAESEEKNEEKNEEKVELDEEDDLVSKIVKVAETEEEEEVDLLRDLKGQKFNVEELEKDLSSVLNKLRGMKNARSE
ncbi:MAG: hypothetical protein QFX40_06475 [Archaeoglobales archaeon]|nr:hypothetical protein [Archaeoglobales archaeon]